MDSGSDSQQSSPQSHNPISIRTSVIITCITTGVIIILFIIWFAKCYYFKRVITTRAAATVSGPSSPSSISESNFTLANGHVVLSSIPIFVYTLPTGEGRLDCSVCLGEFRDRERGRTLPTCHHSFHADCIDTWFRSHSTCPMCRTVVAPEPEPDPDDPQV